MDERHSEGGLGRIQCAATTRGRALGCERERSQPRPHVCAVYSGNPHRRTALDSRDAKKPVRFTATFTTMPAIRIRVRVRLGND